MSIVSFDFDDTLDRKDVQEYARELIRRGVVVIICTSRYNKHPNDEHGLFNADLEEVADELGVMQIVYCDMVDKYKLLTEMGYTIVWHLDDDPNELTMLNRYSNIRGISVYNTTGWKQKCDRLLKEVKNDK